MKQKVRIEVNKNIAIPIHEQIYLQIKNLILGTELIPGDRLPSVRQMSDMVGVNRHTVSHAYSVLEKEDLVQTLAYSGTFVKELPTGTKSKEMEILGNLIDSLFKSGNYLGLDNTTILSAVYARTFAGNTNVHRGLFVECNSFALNQFVKDTKAEIDNFEVDGCLIGNLSPEYIENMDLDQYDVIMTTVGHYAEVKDILHVDNICALNFGPYLSVLGEINSLPKKTNFSIFCLTDHGAQGLRDVLVDLGIEPKHLRAGSLENKEQLAELIDMADVLVVSKYALDQNSDIFKRSNKRIIEYRNVLQRSSVRMLNEVISIQDKQRLKTILNSLDLSGENNEQ